MKLVEQDFATEERQKRLADTQDALAVVARLDEIIDSIFLGTDCPNDGTRMVCVTYREQLEAYAERLKEELDRRDELMAALEGIEKWWVEVGQHLYIGAPAEIFNVRAAIAKAKNA
jgi:hypothetical protein